MHAPFQDASSIEHPPLLEGGSGVGGVPPLPSGANVVTYVMTSSAGGPGPGFAYAPGPAYAGIILHSHRSLAEEGLGISLF